MASFKQYTASGGSSESFSIKTFAKEEINVRVDGVLKSAGTHYNITNYTTNGGTVTWTSGNIPSSGTVRIYRLTDLDPAQATYSTGASLKANDLNDNQTQVLRALEEAGSRTENLVQNWDIEPDAVTTTEIKDETIVNANISPTAEIAVSKLKDGTARQLLQTASNGSDVEWASSIDIPSTLDVTGATTLDSTLNVEGATTFQDNVTINADNKTFTIENQAGTDKFTVDTDTGNINTAGSLTVTAGSSLNGDVIAYSDFNIRNDNKTFTIETSGGTDKFTVQTASGNTMIAGTLNVTGAITGNLTGKASQLADAASVTNSEQTGFTVTDDTYFTTKASDARYYNIGSTEEIISSETWVSDDASIATTKAVDNRVINLVDEVGGFRAITNEYNFPDNDPDINNDTGTVVSIGTLTQSYTASDPGGEFVVTNGAGSGVDVTIVGLIAGHTYPTNFGMLVETTGVEHRYKFHRLTPKATEVTTVAGISSNITTVAGIASDVTTVAGKSTEISRLGTSDAVADLAILGTADVVSDMNTLATADIVSDMNTLATSDVVSDLDTVAGISSNVTTVAGVSGNVTTVAGISANVTTVAGKASDVTAVAGKITEVETVADNLAAVENFNDTYQIHSFSPSAPTTDGGGVDALAEGDLAYDTTNDKLKVWTGSAWETGVEGHTNLMARAGGTFTGDVTFNDDVVLNLGSDNDVRVYHTGDTAYFNVVTGDLHIRTQGTDNAVVCTRDAGVALYYDNVRKFETTSAGFDVLGNIAITGTVDGVDIATRDGVLTSTTTTANAALPKAGGTITGDVLFDNGTNAGKDMIWDVSDDTLKLSDDVQLSLGSDRDIRFYHTGTDGYINVVTGNFNIRTNGTESAIIVKPNAGVELYYDASQKLTTTTDGIDVTGTVTTDGASHAGDVIFQGDGANSYWDKSNDSLIFNDNAGVNLGTDRDVRFYFDGNHAYMNVVTGDLNIRTSGTESAIVCTKDAGVATYYNGNKKTETTNTGIDITGNITISGTVDGIDIATDVAANTLKVTNATHTGEVTGATALTITDDAVTYAKMQNVSATDRVLGRDSAGAGIVEEISPSSLRTMINVEDGADVTDATNVDAAGAIMHTDLGTKGQIVVGDGSGDATILGVGSNDYVLTADSSEASGVKWAAISGGTDTTYSISCADGDDAASEKIRLTAGGSGSGTDDVVIAVSTGLSIARSSDTITLTNTVSNTDTQLSTEQVQDIVGAMFSGNTETRISATYQDADGTIDLVVDDQSTDNNTTYSISCVDGDNPDEEKIRLTDSGSGTDDVVLEAGTGLSIARSSDKITFTNTVTDTSTFIGLSDTPGSMGSAGQHIKVNSAGNALEFTAAPAGTITALNNATENELCTIGNTTTELDAEANLTFQDTTSTGLICGKQITGRGFECPAEVSDDWTIAAANNAMFPGPMSVAANKTVTVPANRTLTIV